IHTHTPVIRYRAVIFHPTQSLRVVTDTLCIMYGGIDDRHHVDIGDVAMRVVLEPHRRLLTSSITFDTRILSHPLRYRRRRPPSAAGLPRSPSTPSDRRVDRGCDRHPPQHGKPPR